ncbi:MAG: hypothetical protein K5985_09030 [Lachnospiraceae bacterium]|nr:hypothetical protein [Lachnospiraceae bacterium]
MYKNRLCRKFFPAATAGICALLMVSPLPLLASESAPAPPPGAMGEAPDMPPGEGGKPGGPMGVEAVTEWDAIQEYFEDEEDEEVVIQSNGPDENAVLVSEGAKVKLIDLDLERNSSDSTGGDAASFYGVGAAFLNTDGEALLAGGSVYTDSAGGAGLFSYDKGITYAEDYYIETLQNTSGGLHVAGGGSLYAWNSFVSTEGESSAAIRSDRGGGKMVIDGGEYISTGAGSPAVYCTADISVHDAMLTAEGSEGVCLEGKNTLRLFDSHLSSAMKEDDRNDCTWSVIVYQSGSGDSEEGEGTFEMTGGSLSSNNGGLFYTTNTKSRFLLSGVDMSSVTKPDFFLRATGNVNKRGWGKSGKNGADCVFTMKNQSAAGDVICDSISNLKLFLTEESTLKGAFKEDESASIAGGSGSSSLTIDKKSKWIVTGDSVVTHLHNGGKIEDENGKKVTVKGADGKVLVKGKSDFTVTVTDYDKTADLTGISEEESWESYSVEKPAFLVENEYDPEEEEIYEEDGEEDIEEIDLTEGEEGPAEEEVQTKSSPVKAAVVIIIGVLGALAVLLWKKLPLKNPGKKPSGK